MLENLEKWHTDKMTEKWRARLNKQEEKKLEKTEVGKEEKYEKNILREWRKWQKDKDEFKG